MGDDDEGGCFGRLFRQRGSEAGERVEMSLSKTGDLSHFNLNPPLFFFVLRTCSNVTKRARMKGNIQALPDKIELLTVKRVSS